GAVVADAQERGGGAVRLAADDLVDRHGEIRERRRRALALGLGAGPGGELAGGRSAAAVPLALLAAGQAARAARREQSGGEQRRAGDATPSCPSCGRGVGLVGL